MIPIRDGAVSRPQMPESYGLAAGHAGAGLLPWTGATERLAAARNYWIGTTRPDGRPHAMPVWGVWLDGALYFGADRRSRKARNLAACPAVVVHQESGDDVVILEGLAEPVSDPGLLAGVDAAYAAKYGLRLTEHPGEVALFAVRPRTAFVWREADLPGTATRWQFGGER